MSKCTEIQILLSEYLDGELNNDDTRRVKEHLAQCEQCSGLLKIYYEISEAVSETLAPPPEQLLSKVMGKIRAGYPKDELKDPNINDGELNIANEKSNGSQITNIINSHENNLDNNDRDSSVSKRPETTNRIMRIFLSRLLPLAACLVIILFSLPRINGRFSSNNEVNYSNSSSQKMTAEDSSGGGIPQESSVIRSTYENAEQYSADGNVAGNGALKDEAGSSARGNIATPGSYEVDRNSDSDSGAVSEPSGAAGITSSSAPAVVDAPAELPETLLTNDSADSQENSIQQNSGILDPIFDSTIAPPHESSGTDVATEESDTQYYAVIRILAELPEMLKEAGLQIIQIDDYTQFIVIPRELAVRLIAEENSVSNVTNFEIYNESAETALVQFSTRDT